MISSLPKSPVGPVASPRDLPPTHSPFLLVPYLLSYGSFSPIVDQSSFVPLDFSQFFFFDNLKG